jgi:putative membrane protein
LIQINAAARPTLMLPHHPKEDVMMWWWEGYGPGPWMYLGPVFFVVMLFACGVMMMYMMRGRQGGRSGALEILKERFARGEINRAEYEERRRMLDA